MNGHKKPQGWLHHVVVTLRDYLATAKKSVRKASIKTDYTYILYKKLLIRIPALSRPPRMKKLKYWEKITQETCQLVLELQIQCIFLSN